jgi:hypothetical protein
MQPRVWVSIGIIASFAGPTLYRQLALIDKSSSSK